MTLLPAPCCHRWHCCCSYAWGSLMKNQFGGSTAEFVGGQTALEYYSLAGINSWVWLVLEMCFFLVFFVFAFLALTYVRHVRR